MELLFASSFVAMDGRLSESFCFDVVSSNDASDVEFKSVCDKFSDVTRGFGSKPLRLPLPPVKLNVRFVNNIIN